MGQVLETGGRECREDAKYSIESKSSKFPKRLGTSIPTGLRAMPVPVPNLNVLVEDGHTIVMIFIQIVNWKELGKNGTLSNF